MIKGYSYYHCLMNRSVEWGVNKSCRVTKLRTLNVPNVPWTSILPSKYTGILLTNNDCFLIKFQIKNENIEYWSIHQGINNSFQYKLCCSY